MISHQGKLILPTTIQNHRTHKFWKVISLWLHADSSTMPWSNIVSKKLENFLKNKSQNLIWRVALIQIQISNCRCQKILIINHRMKNYRQNLILKLIWGKGRFQLIQFSRIKKMKIKRINSQKSTWASVRQNKLKIFHL